MTIPCLDLYTAQQVQPSVPQKDPQIGNRHLLRPGNRAVKAMDRPSIRATG